MRVSFYQILKTPPLDEESKQYIELRFMAGMSYREIGEVFHTPAKTIQSRINKALTKLKEYYFKGGKP